MAKRIFPATFQAEDGSQFQEATMKRTIVRDGKTYKRIPRPKPPSRATRCAEACTAIRGQLDTLEDLRTKIDNPDELKMSDIQEIVSHFASEIENLDMGELETLRDEMTEWRDNMDGTGLENTSKFQEVSDAADTLENQVDELSSLNFDVDVRDNSLEEVSDAMGEAIDTIESALGELENVSFPGMF